MLITHLPVLLARQNGGAGTNDNDGYANKAVFQGDGNFVVYSKTPNGWTPKWASGTNPSGAKLNLQGDGNLALYNSSGGHLWNAGTQD